MIYIVSLLLISQLYIFYLLKTKRKVKEVDDRLFLKEIPKGVEYNDIEEDYKTIFSVLESIKLEDWELKIEIDYKCYDLEFISNSNITVSSRVRVDSDNNIRLVWFRIRSEAGAISIDNNDKIKNDVLNFLWDYIIEYYNNRNDKNTKYYNEVIKSISSKLKTLNRDNKLKNILK
jgi:hypothetical protein